MWAHKIKLSFSELKFPKFNVHYFHVLQLFSLYGCVGVCTDVCVGVCTGVCGCVHWFSFCSHQSVAAVHTHTHTTQHTLRSTFNPVQNFLCKERSAREMRTH